MKELFTLHYHRRILFTEIFSYSLSLTVHLDNEAYPSTAIELYRYDGTNCLAKVDGKIFALIPRSEVVDLIEAVNSIVLNEYSADKTK